MPRRRPRQPGRFAVLPLAGHEVSVHWVRKLAEREGCDGCWRGEAWRVDLDAALTRTEAQEVLIHELAHAVSDVYDLGLEEATVRALALGLQQSLSPYLKVIR